MNKISVIVPCYNQSQYLSEAVQSVIAQTYTDWECIIINDGSRDNTEEVAKELVKKDTRIKYYKKENGGLSSARNAGLEKAQGTYIQFLDADDLITEDKFYKAIEYFEQDSTCELVLSNFQMLKDLDKSYTPAYCDLSNIDFCYEAILLDWDFSFSIPIHCGIFNARLFKTYRFNTALKAKEDWLMWLTVFKELKGFRFINEIEAIYREHTSSMTKDKPHMYENIGNAFKYIFFNEIEERYKVKFFDKINTYWMKEVLDYQNYYKEIYKSTSFKIGSKIVKNLSWLKR